MLKIENIVPRNWRNVKTHNLISGIKSEDTYGYVPDYTKPLTCIGCHIGFTFYPRPVLAFGYCHRLCLCVCPCVCVCVYQSLACPHDNSSAVHARITKFGWETQNTLVKMPIIFGGDRPWPSRSNSTWKSKFTSITFHSFKLESPNLDQKCILVRLRSLLFWGLIDRDLQCQI